MTVRQYPIVVLWAHPRSRSTATERIFIERKDFTVFHEPFQPLYYDRDNENKKRSKIELKDETGKLAAMYECTKQKILEAAEHSPVFFKDMPYYCFQHVQKDETFLHRLTHTFIVRPPADAIASHFFLSPDLQQDEIGYEGQWKLFCRIQNVCAHQPLVIDSEELIAHPDAVIAAFCRQLGIEDVPMALCWDATLGLADEIKKSAYWHEKLAVSQGFNTHKKVSYVVTIYNNEALKAMYDHEVPFYDQLRDNRMEIDGMTLLPP